MAMPTTLNQNLPSSSTANNAARADAAPEAPKADGRRSELDWLRVAVVLGLIPYHVAVVFAVGPGDYIQNSDRSIVFDAGATLAAFVGMPLLFLVAGAATWYALGSRTALAYLTERLRRLAVPLIFGILALVPIQLYMDRLNTPGYSLNYPQFYGQFLDDWTHIIQHRIFGRGFQYWGHLWFLLYLLAVSLILLPLLSWLRHGAGRRYSAQLARLATRPLGLLLLGAPLCLVEVILQGPVGTRPALDYNNLYGGVAGLILYAVAFLLGFLLVPDGAFQRTVIRLRAHLLWMAILLLAAHELALGLFDAPIQGSPLALAVIRLARGMITWLLLIAALGFASRYLSAGSRLLRALGEASFPLYVLHMPILTVLAYVIVRWDMPIFVKCGALLMLTSALTGAVYALVVRPIPVMRFLFGLKPRPPGIPPRPDVAAPAADERAR
jgi:peptidoglycan/LPS O-acetylase OafA/YrhL